MKLSCLVHPQPSYIWPFNSPPPRSNRDLQVAALSGATYMNTRKYCCLLFCIQPPDNQIILLHFVSDQKPLEPFATFTPLITRCRFYRHSLPFPITNDFKNKPLVIYRPLCVYVCFITLGGGLNEGFYLKVEVRSRKFWKCLEQKVLSKPARF